MSASVRWAGTGWTSIGRQVERLLLRAPGGVHAAGAVAHRRHRDAVVVGEDPADPAARGELVLGYPDGPPHEVARLVDPAPGVDVDPVVAEGPRGEHRDRHER